MLGRKVPGPSGMDRGRIGERLHAALAGLQELHLLRDKQSSRVQWALTLNREESDKSKQDSVSTEELRLEATLNLLKQQLSRLRKQDVGLKTHLQQLDQQISELKLDVCKASTEHLESDSRPSSGFFELSDGGSGSLSNSCTSVYSESLSCSSQNNLLPLLSASYSSPGRNASGPTSVSRCCSADESMAQTDVPRSLGVKLGSGCIRLPPGKPQRARQRPVSTGDLDRVITSGIGTFRSTDVKTSTICGSLHNPSVDVKYQSNLVSSSGTEVYCYPSPLHAVALQSPIFSITGDQGCQVVSEAQDENLGDGLEDVTQNPNQGSTNSQCAGYINKLLQRSSSKISLLNEIRGDPHTAIKSSEEQRPRSQEMNNGHPQLRGSLQQLTLPLANTQDIEKTSSALNGNQQKINMESSLDLVKVQPLYRDTHQAPLKDLQQNYIPLNNAIVKTSAESDPRLSDKGSRHSFESSSVSKSLERQSSFTLRKEEQRSFDLTPHSEEFVHAEFVPAGSQRMKVRQADKKTKSVKLRKKSTEKPSTKKQQQKHLCTKTRADMKQSGLCKGKVTNLEESHMYSSSDGSRNGLFNMHCVQNKSHQTSKPIKSHKPHYPELVHIPQDQSRKKQSSRKWPSASEIQLPTTLNAPRSKEMPASRKTGMMRSLSARPRSGQWGCAPRPLCQSLSTSSYLSYLESRYPAAPKSGRYPPRCESEFSEYSAECASLFHSTIAASSDGEMSDYTTNRFGDSESSQGSQTASDSDSSLSLDEEDLLEEEEEGEVGLVWAQATMGPTAAGISMQQRQRSDSAACRIKASRALKKKIRRFQPASLKVMTLV
ncbi:dapper homolog 2 [Triplophysa rosa]|uniref:Dapper-like protein 2 n=1 Tax=Triplophysa rosa TaxID=992332 RepID=A0A9W7WP35_TRIRA|nr:dapper homolog 2 [Triplophysa rosa]KAI7805696.1 Dapper-like protein 2 [Triplophysa rosa]